MLKSKTIVGLAASMWLVGNGWNPTALAADDSTLPDRRITAALQYPGITIAPEDSISVDLLIKNRGRSDETVLVDVIEKPKDWNVQIKRYGTIVSGVFVASESDQTLTLSARLADEKAKKLPPGKYKFAIKAHTPDGKLEQTSAITVTVQGKGKTGSRITVDTSYPVLRGPSGDKFEFSLDVRNDSDQDAVFNFRATAPPGWETSFKPAYESKQISSLQIKANESKTVNFGVTPPYNATAGEYDFQVEVASPKNKVQQDLQVVLTGTYSIEADTPTGLLSLVTHRGQEVRASVLVHNTGSAAQKEISFLSFKPENWKVEFEPEKITDLEPGAMKEVEVTITPAKEALIGDYSVALDVNGEKAKDNLEFRITVKASSAWGWIGVAIILVAIAGLAVTFKVLGRR